MSIKKINNLKFEHVFPSYGCMNDTNDIEFDKDGITIDYDTISWDDIKIAYKKIFGDDLAT